MMSDETIPTEGLGFLDLLETMETNTKRLVETVNNLNSDTKEVGERISERSQEIQSVATTSGEHPLAKSQTRKQIQRLVNQAASELLTYAASVRGKLPSFEQEIADSSGAIRQIVIIYTEDMSADEQQIADTKESLSRLYESIGDAVVSMTSFRNSIVSLPRMTTHLNVAKKETGDVLQRVISSMSSGHKTIGEALQIM